MYGLWECEATLDIIWEKEDSHATLVSRSFRRIDYEDGTTGNRHANTRYNTILQYNIQRYTEIEKQEQG